MSEMFRVSVFRVMIRCRFTSIIHMHTIRIHFSTMAPDTLRELSVQSLHVHLIVSDATGAFSGTRAPLPLLDRKGGPEATHIVHNLISYHTCAHQYHRRIHLLVPSLRTIWNHILCRAEPQFQAQSHTFHHVAHEQDMTSCYMYHHTVHVHVLEY